MWTIAISVFAATSLTYVLKYLSDETSIAFNAFFIASSRNLWALSVAWFIFAFDCGSGRWINDFLSHRYWIPIGRIGLCLYLVHPVVQYASVSSQKQPISIDMLQMVSAIFIFPTRLRFLIFLDEQLFRRHFNDVPNLNSPAPARGGAVHANRKARHKELEQTVGSQQDWRCEEQQYDCVELCLWKSQ